LTNLNQPRAFAAVILLLAACNPEAWAAFDYRSNLGIAVEKTNRNCLDIRNGTLAVGQKIQFVNASTPQTTGEVEVTGKVDQACTPADQSEQGLYHYEFKVIRGTLQMAAPAFALTNFTGTLTTAGTGITADLDGDGHPESFRSCTSSEGVHLTVWKGKPLKGRRKWHSYYYLGYDVDPTCTKRDTKPGTP
jgi:hypothetical protein